MSRLAQLLLLLVTLIGLLALILHWSADPGPTAPLVLPGGTATHRVFDLLRAPAGAQIEGRELPGTPQRYLLASLSQGKLTVAWLTDPTAAPETAIDLPAKGMLIEAYLDRHSAGWAVVEVWKDYTPVAGRQVFEIRVQ